MKKDFLYYQSIVYKCYLSQNKPIVYSTEEELRKNLILIDDYIDIISEEFSGYGLRDDYEPNNYGIELEDSIDFFLKYRYAIADKK